MRALSALLLASAVLFVGASPLPADCYAHQSYGSSYGHPSYGGHRQVFIAPSYYFSAQSFYLVGRGDVVAIQGTISQPVQGGSLGGVASPNLEQASPNPGIAPPGPGGLRTAPAPGGSNQRLAALLESRCVRCHGGPQGTKGKVDLRQPDSVPTQVRKECYKQVSKGLMPQKENPLSDSDSDLFLDWLSAPLVAAAQK